VSFGNPWGAPPESFQQDRQAWDSPQRLDGSPRNRPDGVTRPGAAAGGLVGVTAPHWYSNLIEGVAPVGVVAVQPAALAQVAPGVRNLLMLRNSGATNLFIGFGSPATANSTLRITSNTIVLFDTVVPQNDIWVLSDAAGGQLSYSYSTTVET
jgi:hypothetical protein